MTLVGWGALRGRSSRLGRRRGIGAAVGARASTKLVEQRLCLFEVRRVEAFGGGQRGRILYGYSAGEARCGPTQFYFVPSSKPRAPEAKKTPYQFPRP